MDMQDKADCLLLLLGRPAEEAAFWAGGGGSVEELISEICNSDEFRESVLSPLMLGEALPQERIAAIPPFKVIDWAQRRLPLHPDTRRAAGAARTWTNLLELLLSDNELVTLLPEFREAEIDACLRERAQQGPLARAQRTLVGAIDAVSAFEISGWALELCDKSVPVTLDFYADSIFIGSAICNESRPDVQEAVGGDGRCGFHFRIAHAHRGCLTSGRTIAALDSISRQVIGTPALVHADPALGWDLLHDARRELTEMRRAILRIEARLPDLSRLASTPLDAYGEYWERFYRLAPDVTHAQRLAAAQFDYRPVISIVMPTWNGEAQLLGQAIDSVLAQSYTSWELIIADDASTSREAFSRWRAHHAHEPRIRWIAAEVREGIGANTNRAIALARGEYVAFMDHDDELAADALYRTLEKLQEHRYALVYSDEDRIENDALGGCVHHTPFFKPGFDPDLLRSLNYICHLVVMRRDLLLELGGLASHCEGAQDHDLLLRAAARIKAADVAHVDRILYHWRVTPGSVSRLPGQQKAIQDAIVAAVNAQLSELGVDALAEAHRDAEGVDRAFATRVRWSLPAAVPSVAIIVPTRDRLDLLIPCIASILDTATQYPGRQQLVIVDNNSAEPATLAYFEALASQAHATVMSYPGAFNWSAINNFAAHALDADVLLFLNNDTVVRSRDWLTELAGNAVRNDVGAVGARLLYGDGTIQHAGVVLGVDGVAGHDSVGEGTHQGGYFGRTHLMRSAAAVTGACLATRRSVFTEVGGFDEHRLKVAFNDIDFCMKVRQAGYRVVYNPFAVLYHFESKSRGRELTHAQQSRHGAEASAFGERWGASVWNDPYYNAHFERYAQPFSRIRPRT